jgi:hypothetical protein
LAILIDIFLQNQLTLLFDSMDIKGYFIVSQVFFSVLEAHLLRAECNLGIVSGQAGLLHVLIGGQTSVTCLTQTNTRNIIQTHGKPVTQTQVTEKPIF